MVDYSKYPRYLYKYCPFNKEIISSFINNEFWFSNPNDFNDPYDCKIELDFETNVNELREYYEKSNNHYTKFIKDKINEEKEAILKGHSLTGLISFIKFLYGNPLLEDDFIYQKVAEIQQGKEFYSHDLIDQRIKEYKKNPIEFMNHIIEISKEEISKYRILCLSKIKNSSTMWAHYSDHHKGICIKFDIKADKEFFSFPLKVNYYRQYPKYNYIKKWGEHGAAKHIFSAKNNSWVYENEIRIVKDKSLIKFKKEGLLKINKNAVKEVNFGLKSTASDIELFQEINKKYYDNKIKIFQAQEKPKSFYLDFKKIH